MVLFDTPPQKQQTQPQGLLVANSSLAVMSSGIHEVKNILNDVRISILVGSKEQEYYIEMLARAESRLSKMLYTYRLSSGEISLCLDACSIDSLVYELVDARSFEYHHKTIQTEVMGHPVVLCDRDLVSDVLSNALQNALRHANEKVLISVFLSETKADCPPVCTGYDDVSPDLFSSVTVEVHDDGEGYSHACIKKMGELGHGLYIAERIAHLHQRNGQYGAVSLHASDTLGGACFRLTLP